jgi:hypothetical protein
MRGFSGRFGPRWGCYHEEWQEDRTSYVDSKLGAYVRIYPREFGGNMGHILVIDYLYIDNGAYAAHYYAVDNKVRINVYSAYPWNKGTTNLLNTIHVEKAGNR